MDVYQHIFNQANEAILILEGETVCDCNLSFLALWGQCSESGLEGKNVSDLFSEEIGCSKDFVEKLRQFKDRAEITEPTFETQIRTDLFASVKLSCLPRNSSSANQTSSERYTIVSISPLAKEKSKMETLCLGGNSLQLSVGSLSNFVTELFEDFPIGVAVNDLNTGKFVSANKSLLDSLQYNLSELCNLSFQEITPPEYEEVDAKAVESLTETGSFSLFKKEYFRKDGSRVWVSLYGGVVLKTKEHNYVWSFIEDITEAERSKQRLRDQIKRMTFATHQTQTGVWELDLESGQLEWSDEVFRIFEIDKAKFGASYEAFLATIHPADRELVNNAYQQSLVDKAPYEIVHRLQMSDGRIKFVNERCTTTFDHNGKPLVSMGTVQDITSANQTRAEIERCPILEASRDFIGIANLDGRVTFINESGREMIGLSNNLDKDVWMIADLYTDSVQELLATEVMPALASSGRWFGDLSLKKIGTDESVLIECDAFRVDNPTTGEPVCYAAASQNITQRKAAELELEAYKETLEHRVLERTVALKEANDKAQQASEAKSAFLSRMSHELRTPLNAVLGFSQLARDEINGDQQRMLAENVDEIVSAGTHLLNLVNEILDISLIENSDSKLAKKELRISSVIKKTISALSSSLKVKHIELELDNFSDELVLGDQERVAQVIQNVLSNAIKFSRNGGVIRLYSTPTDGDHFILVIEDAGVGIASEKLDLILEPFERLESDLYEGTGIGLTIANKLMDLMDGSLRIESRLGQGTRVYLEFVRSQNSKAQQLNVDKEDALGVDDRKKLLYVEDIPANMRLMSRFISKLGDVDFLEAVDGQTGIDIAVSSRPDIILLDINLPDMNGFQVLEVLRNSEKTKDIPVIAVSASVYPSDIEKALSSGFDEYVIKPIDHNVLLDKVRSFIQEV